MKIQLLIATLMLSVLSVKGQSLSEANNFFTNYEYAKAANLFETIQQKSALQLEDFKKLVYSYYVIGDFKHCQPLIDSLVQVNDIEPYFYFIHGRTCMANQRFYEAKQSFLQFELLEGSEDVAPLIESCLSIASWDSIQYVRLDNIATNFSKANSTGPKWNNGEIVYKELGKDENGALLPDSLVDEAALLVLHPFLRTEGGDLQPLKFMDSVQYKSMSSIALGKDNKVFIAISRPIESKNTQSVPHIFEGYYSPETQTVNTLSPWKFGGFADTSACAHLTINESGNLIVFAKAKLGDHSSDLFMSEWKNDDWTEPKKITQLNTHSDEMYPMFSGDSLLSFATNGRVGYGGLDLYLSRVNGNQFEEPVHLKHPINSAMDDFNLVYYSADSARFSSNRFGGKGDDDAYFILLKEEIPVVEPEIDTFMVNWVPPRIYFDFDKFDIKRDVAKLGDLIDYLKNHPTIKIEVEGHCDERGSDAYNYKLGLERSNSVKDELEKAGISKDQMIVSSKGKSKPFVDCSGGCPEKDHALNRVVVIYLVDNKE